MQVGTGEQAHNFYHLPYPHRMCWYGCLSLATGAGNRWREYYANTETVQDSSAFFSTLIRLLVILVVAIKSTLNSLTVACLTQFALSTRLYTASNLFHFLHFSLVLISAKSSF